MKSLLELLTAFNWLAIPETILGTFVNADWHRARKRGLVGILAEVVHSLLGTNSAAIFIPLDSGINGQAIERLLQRYGIRSWGWGVYRGEMFFRVRRSQAAWAQYILTQEGILSGEPRPPFYEQRSSTESPDISGTDQVKSPASNPATESMSLTARAEHFIDQVGHILDNLVK